MSRICKGGGLRVASLLIVGLAAACSDLPLTLADPATPATGDYCTNDADIYNVPIRILFVVDCSESMAGGANGVPPGNDTTGQRAAAVAGLISHFSSNTNVTFGLVTFDSAAFNLTGGFTADPAILNPAIAQISVGTGAQGFTNYLGALAVAQSMVTADVAAVAAAMAKLDPNDPSIRYMRPAYFVVFLSDGVPRIADPIQGLIIEETGSILYEVTNLVAAGTGTYAAGLKLDTAFLWNFAQNPNDPQISPAEALLQQMASTGGGSYFSFATGQPIDFSIFDFTVIRSYGIHQFYVYNRNVIMTPKGPEVDSDGDGLSDDDEINKYGTDPTNPDTDGDGCEDGFEVTHGFDPRAPDCPCSTTQRNDTDNDGLIDCEEVLVASDINKFDSDGDGLTDWLEVRYGTNPIDATDWDQDPDADGVMSMTEIFTGMSPIRAETQAIRDMYAYRYTKTINTPPGAPQTCYTFDVSNVGLGPTLATASRAALINEVVIEAIESPKDDPEKEFMLRRLVVPVTYGKPLSQSISTSSTIFDTVSRYQLP